MMMKMHLWLRHVISQLILMEWDTLTLLWTWQFQNGKFSLCVWCILIPWYILFRPTFCKCLWHVIVFYITGAHATTAEKCQQTGKTNAVIMMTTNFKKQFKNHLGNQSASRNMKDSCIAVSVYMYWGWVFTHISKKKVPLDTMSAFMSKCWVIKYNFIYPVSIKQNKNI